MLLQRRIARTKTTAPPAPGFIGPGHTAVEVLTPDDFSGNDPFILLMDDRLDIGEKPIGGPHPHAGFETVTLLLEGAIRDRFEGGIIRAGEVQWMTAGSGIIHSENVEALGKVRLLQLWLTLPKSHRWTDPGFQDIHADSIPVYQSDGVEVRVYSGTSGGMRSSTRNHVPVTLAEIRLKAGRSFEQEVPGGYNGFVYVIDGSARLGAGGTLLREGQIGWLDMPSVDGATLLPITGGAEGVRLVFYAGQRQGDPIVHRGPFVGDSSQDIARLFSEYRSGRFQRMSELSRSRATAIR